MHLGDAIRQRRLYGGADVVDDFRHERCRGFRRGQARQAVCDTFVLFVELLAWRAFAQMFDNLRAVGLQRIAHVIPKFFDVTAAHLVFLLDRGILGRHDTADLGA